MKVSAKFVILDPRFVKISSAKNSRENFFLKGTNSKFIQILFKLTLDFTYRYHFLLVGNYSGIGT